MTHDLMTFIEIAKPSWYERWLVLLAQGVFYNGLFLLYLVSSRTAHRVVGYFEEEAISAIPSTWPRLRAAGSRILPRHKSPSTTEDDQFKTAHSVPGQRMRVGTLCRLRALAQGAQNKVSVCYDRVRNPV